MDPAQILKKPYARVVVPEADGSFTAEILEFPGCVASGENAAEALANVDEIAIDWIDAALEQGQTIPEPLDHSKYSGKLVVRMPRSLHQRAARVAERDGVSLNQFIVTCIAEEVGVRSRPVVAYPQLQAIANLSFSVDVGRVMAPRGTIAVAGAQSIATDQQVVQLPRWREVVRA